VRVLAAFVAIIAIALVAMASLGQFGPSEPGAAPRSAAPSAAPTGATAASATPTPSRAITISFTEAELTRAAEAYTPLTVSGITVTDPRIRLEPGRLTLTATGRAFIFSAPIVVVASPVVSNGTAAAKIETATFGGQALPESTKQEIADTFSRTLAANIPAGVRVTGMTVNAGVLVVEALPA
jgi:hypothetical protein